MLEMMVNCAWNSSPFLAGPLIFCDRIPIIILVFHFCCQTFPSGYLWYKNVTPYCTCVSGFAYIGSFKLFGKKLRYNCDIKSRIVKLQPRGGCSVFVAGNYIDIQIALDYLLYSSFLFLAGKLITLVSK